MWNCNWGFMNGTGPGWFMGGGFGMLFNLFLLVAAVILAYKLIQRFVLRPEGSRDKNDSLEILKRKYANGEIDDEEFRRIREVLEA